MRPLSCVQGKRIQMGRNCSLLLSWLTSSRGNTDKGKIQDKPQDKNTSRVWWKNEQLQRKTINSQLFCIEINLAELWSHTHTLTGSGCKSAKSPGKGKSLTGRLFTTEKECKPCRSEDKLRQATTIGRPAELWKQRSIRLQFNHL